MEWIWIIALPLAAAAVLMLKSPMTILTRCLLAVWLSFGIAFWSVLNFWTARWWNPFDIPATFVELLIHLAAVALCYGIPLYLLVRLFRWLRQS